MENFKKFSICDEDMETTVSNTSGPLLGIGAFIDKIKAKLDSDARFHFLGRGANEGVWATREKGEEGCGNFIELKKNLAKKGYGAFEIYLYEETEQGVEFKVRMYVPSYCEWDTFFEGFLENENDFERVMIMLGLN